MYTTWKYPLKVQAQQTISIPRNSTMLTVQVQGDTPCLWVQVDTDEPSDDVIIRTFGTGHEMPNDPGEYVSTYQELGGSLVWHVFWDWAESGS